MQYSISGDWSPGLPLPYGSAAPESVRAGGPYTGCLLGSRVFFGFTSRAVPGVYVISRTRGIDKLLCNAVPRRIQPTREVGSAGQYRTTWPELSPRSCVLPPAPERSTVSHKHGTGLSPSDTRQEEIENLIVSIPRGADDASAAAATSVQTLVPIPPTIVLTKPRIVEHNAHSARPEQEVHKVYPRPRSPLCDPSSTKQSKRIKTTIFTHSGPAMTLP